MDLKLSEETLMKLGFRLLDICYGELTIKKGISWNEVFVDKDSVSRLGYDKPRMVNSPLEDQSVLAYSHKDSEFFLSIIPVKVIDYERTLKAWVKERYKRRVDTTRCIG